MDTESDTGVSDDSVMSGVTVPLRPVKQALFYRLSRMASWLMVPRYYSAHES